MIMFHLPNFRVRISEIKLDEDGEKIISKEKVWRYCYAINAQQALALVGRDPYKYIHEDTLEEVDFSQHWSNELEDTIAKINDAIAKNQEPEFPSKWKIVKDHLIDLFHGKCAYCEAKFTATGFGDVEHYRPKGRVHGQQGPGYYWLAYEPSNYLPSCQICNQRAKGDNFPISGMRAKSKDDPLNVENPLLMNPYQDNYEDHLEFIPTSGGAPHADRLPGGVISKTDKGKASIGTLEIYREPIREERIREMSYARMDIKDAYKKLGDTQNWDEFLRSLELYLSEERPFRTAVYYEIYDFLVNVRYWNDDTVKQTLAALGFHNG